MKSLKYLFFVSILIFLMAACTDKSLSPIFFTLETERSLTEDRGLEDGMTVHEVVKVGGAGTRYFAAGNTLYTRTETGNWTPVSPPVAGALCNTIEIFGGDLYAGFFTKDGTGLGLYYTDPVAISWNQVSDADIDNGQINLLKAVGPTYLFVSSLKTDGSGDYFLYYSSNPTVADTIDPVTFDTDPSGSIPIIDIEYDGAAYWVIAGPLLYMGPENNLQIQATVSDPATDGGKPFGGLLYSSGNILYLSGKDGKLWSRSAGVWSGATSISVDGGVQFTQFVDVTTVSGNILVGTEGKGYYRLILGDQTNYERRPDYNISALYNGAINCLFLDTSVTPEALFAGTMNAGLWRADYISGEWLWVQE